MSDYLQDGGRGGYIHSDSDPSELSSSSDAASEYQPDDEQVAPPSDEDEAEAAGSEQDSESDEDDENAVSSGNDPEHKHKHGADIKSGSASYSSHSPKGNLKAWNYDDRYEAGAKLKWTFDLDILPHGKTFRCRVCNVSKTKKGEVAKHLANDHQKPLPYECMICYSRFYQPLGLDNHMVTQHHDHPLIVSCDICDERLAGPKALSRHKRNGHARFRCPQCGRELSRLAQLKTHMRTAHPKEKDLLYHCDQCNEKRTSAKSLEGHKRRVHGVPCKICSQTCTLQNLGPHARLVHGTVCNLCNFWSLTLEELVAHKASDHTGDSLLCFLCAASYPSEDSLLRHLNLEHPADEGQGSTKCGRCGRVCVSKAGLGAHIRDLHPSALKSYATIGSAKIDLEKSATWNLLISSTQELSVSDLNSTNAFNDLSAAFKDDKLLQGPSIGVKQKIVDMHQTEALRRIKELHHNLEQKFCLKELLQPKAMHHPHDQATDLADPTQEGISIQNSMTSSVATDKHTNTDVSKHPETFTSQILQQYFADELDAPVNPSDGNDLNPYEFGAIVPPAGSYKIIPTDGTGNLCGIRALMLSWEAQLVYDGPLEDDLMDLVPEVRDAQIAFRVHGSPAPEDSNFSIDELAALLRLYASMLPIPITVHLGVVRQNGSGYVVHAPITPNTEVHFLWIHNNQNGEMDEYVLNHYSGLRKDT